MPFTFVTTLLYKAASARDWLLAPGHRKWLIAAGGSVAITLGILLYRGYFHKTVQAALEAEDNKVAAKVLDTARTADEAAQAKSDGIRTTVQNREAIGRHVTQVSLNKHRAWADVPVPDDVLVSLRDDDAPQD